MRIAIFGLGYVGVVNMACFSKLGHTVWGCDVKSQKVDSIKNGISPIHEPGVDELLQLGLSSGLVNASTNAKEVLDNADIALICVGTPSAGDGKVNLDYTINTTLDLVDYLKQNDREFTIVYRSTIPPGTIGDNVLSHFQNWDGKHKPKVAFLPEFLREGTAVKDFFHCSRIVVGSEGEEPKELKELLSFDSNIPLVFTDYKTAEFVKYVDNAFHAMKIAFVNEIYSLGSSFGIDVQKANDIFLMDTHLNVSKNYLRPGLPFGGSCLPKDLRAIQYFAKTNNVQMPVIGNIINSNTMLLDSMLEKIIAKGAKSVSLYGLTFKSGTDDVRESPMLRLLYSMVEKGIDVKVFDHDINLTSLRIEHAAVVKHVVSDADQAFSAAEVIIVCKKGFEDYSSSVNKNAYLFNFYSLKNFNLPNSQEMLYS